ncbi:hypothetical protein Ciccas_013476, partial [Cichlidogyrus casuarinus]
MLSLISFMFLSVYVMVKALTRNALCLALMLRIRQLLPWHKPTAPTEPQHQQHPDLDDLPSMTQQQREQQQREQQLARLDAQGERERECMCRSIHRFCVSLSTHW